MNKTSRNSSTTVLIPAHNEQEIIVETLMTIITQTLKPCEIIVVCDNCTDNTVELVNDFIRKSKETSIRIFETVNNKGRKAGALNQVFDKLKLEKYVLIMDADTLLDKNALEAGVKMLNKDEKLAAICSRAGVLPYKGQSFLKKILWTTQHIEYGQFDSHRIETKDKIKVAHGMATIFRSDALRWIPTYRQEALSIDSGIYLENSLVEDYEITLCLKHKWKVTSSMDMLAWTDVPLSVKELWVQRLRWLRGGVDALRLHSWNRVTLFEILNHWLFLILISFKSVAIIVLILNLSKLGLYSFNPIILVLFFIAFLDSLYRLKYVQNKCKFDYVIKLSLIPEMAYSWFQAVALIYSYILSFCNIKQRW